MGTARRSIVVLVIGTALALSGCGGGEAVQGVGDGRGPAEQARPSDLVGAWGLEDANVDAGAVLTFSPGEISLYADCGSLSGGWAANRAGLFLAEVDGGSGECFPADVDADPAPEWLSSATSFRADGDRRQLLDDAGTVTATLLPDLPADPVASFAEALDLVPTADPATVAALDAEPEPLPADLTPATQEQMLGRWDPVDAPKPKREEAPHLKFRAGRWGASDGCNGSGGRWTISSGGALLATGPGPSTLIGCENRDVAGAFAGAAWAGFDGEELVLVDRAGEESGLLVSSTRF